MIGSLSQFSGLPLTTIYPWSISPTIYARLFLMIVSHTAFCTYILCLYCVGARILAQKLLLKCRWNWHQIFYNSLLGGVYFPVFIVWPILRYFKIILANTISHLGNSFKFGHYTCGHKKYRMISVKLFLSINTSMVDLSLIKRQRPSP